MGEELKFGVWYPTKDAEHNVLYQVGYDGDASAFAYAVLNAAPLEAVPDGA